MATFKVDLDTNRMDVNVENIDILKSIGSDNSIVSLFDIVQDSLTSDSTTTVFSDYNCTSNSGSHAQEFDNSFINLVDPLPASAPNYEDMFPYNFAQIKTPIYERFVPNESLPVYKPTIYKLTIVSLKQEYSTPYEPALNRNWVNLIMELNSTQLNFYTLDKSLTDIVHGYSSNVFENNNDLNTNVKFHNIFKNTKTYMLDELETNELAQRIMKNKAKYLTNQNMVYSLSLQFGKVGIPKDYTKRTNVLRLRLEIQQFMIKFSCIDDLIYWANYIHMGISISLDLTLRDLPNYKVVPRRRRRHRHRHDSNHSRRNNDDHTRDHSQSETLTYLMAQNLSVTDHFNIHSSSQKSENVKNQKQNKTRSKSWNPLFSDQTYSKESTTGLGKTISSKFNSMFKLNKSRSNSAGSSPCNSQRATPSQDSNKKKARSTSLTMMVSNSTSKSPLSSIKKTISTPGAYTLDSKEMDKRSMWKAEILEPSPIKKVNLVDMNLGSENNGTISNMSDEMNSLSRGVSVVTTISEESPVIEPSSFPEYQNNDLTNFHDNYGDINAGAGKNIQGRSFLNVIDEYAHEDDDDELYSDGDYAELMERTNSTNRLSIYNEEGFLHDSEDEDEDYEPQNNPPSYHDYNFRNTDFFLDDNSIHQYERRSEIKWSPPIKQMTRKKFVKHSLRCIKTLNLNKSWVGDICIKPQPTNLTCGVRPIYIGENNKTLKSNQRGKIARNHALSSCMIGAVGYVEFSKKYTILDKVQSQQK